MILKLKVSFYPKFDPRFPSFSPLREFASLRSANIKSIFLSMRDKFYFFKKERVYSSTIKITKPEAKLGTLFCPNNYE